MDIIKKIIFGVIAFLATVVVASFFVPDQFVVKRSIHIDTPLEVVFEQVNDLRNWTNWNFHHSIDPNWEVQFQRRYIGEGAGYVWYGNPETIGNGSLEIISSKPNQEIIVKVHFEKEDKNFLNWFLFEKDERGTDVHIMMDFDVGLDPFKKLAGLQMKWKTNQTFDYDLKRLKEISEVNRFSHQKTNK